jgi:biotin transport system permease protein
VSNFLLGSYRPGTTWLHRIPAGPKLGLLATFGALAVVLQGIWAALGLLAFAFVLVAWSRMPVRSSLTSLRALGIVLVLLIAFQTWQRGPVVAIDVAAGLAAPIIAALVFTATTPIDSVLDAITRGLRPFKVFGVNPEKVSLAFSLVLSSIPRIVDIAQETRAAAKARGLERSPRALLVPMAIRSVAHALETGQALHARGIGDD